jgi:putative tricarboxylic transport membrane protein
VKKIDILCSLFLVGIGTIFCVSALHLGIAKPSAPGPGLIPLGAAVLLILFSLGTMVEAALTSKHKQASPIILGERSWAVFLVLVVLFLYALFMNRLGFVVATFLALTCLFRLSEGQTWRIALGASVLTTLVTYLLFAYALGVSLPQGLLEFTGF